MTGSLGFKDENKSLGKDRLRIIIIIIWVCCSKLKGEFSIIKESAEITSCQKALLMKRIIGNSTFLVQELNRRMKQELSLTPAKYEVLIAIKLSGNSEITMSDLSRQLSVSNANMTGMTKRLNKEGLIDKKRSHQIEEYMVLP